MNHVLLFLVGALGFVAIAWEWSRDVERFNGTLYWVKEPPANEEQPTHPTT